MALPALFKRDNVFYRVSQVKQGSDLIFPLSRRFEETKELVQSLGK